jgi:hypothetical protein
MLGTRLISLLLIAGGILGAMSAVFLIQGSVQHDQPYGPIVPAISIVVFCWSIFQGIQLWRGKPSGYKWAKILFAMQIPGFCVSRLTYEFSTGISARIMFGNSIRRFGADIGSSLNSLISPEPLGWMLGINLVAVAALAYLLKKSGKPAGLPPSTDH